MEKLFYVAKNSEGGGTKVPVTNRFERIQKLNMLLESGWRIKKVCADDSEEYFVLEKEDKR